MENIRPIEHFKFDEQEYEWFCNGIEIWRTVEGHNSYQVSSLGRFRSFKRGEMNVLSFDNHGHGYLRITFCEDGKAKKYPAGRLVGLAFVHNPNNKPQINHENGIKTDNNPNNLTWCTQGENNSHAYRTGLSKGSAFGKKGKLSACSKPIRQLTKKGEFIASYDSVRLAAEATGVDARRISDNALGTKPGGGGFDWRYIY